MSETVKVRVKVTVDPYGGWTQSEYDDIHDGYLSTYPGAKTYVLTAELEVPPVPEDNEVAAGVDEVKP